MVRRSRVRPALAPRRIRGKGAGHRRGRARHHGRTARGELPDSASRADRDRGGSVNPADLEIFQTALSFVPEEMGVALRRTAYSPNIKERMDASCALFDAEGRIISQAEHIPVHLGSMPVAVEAAMRDFPGTLRDGDQIILNDPYRGGTHLPDVTMIRPVFVRQTVIGFAVNRAHHADIGGKVVGSMPATAMRLEDEGLVLEPQKMMDRGHERQAVLERFRQGTWNPAERLGDLRAQVAANELGATLRAAPARSVSAASGRGRGASFRLVLRPLSPPGMSRPRSESSMSCSSLSRSPSPMRSPPKAKAR